LFDADEGAALAANKSGTAEVMMRFRLLQIQWIAGTKALFSFARQV